MSFMSAKHFLLLVIAVLAVSNAQASIKVAFVGGGTVSTHEDDGSAPHGYDGVGSIGGNAVSALNYEKYAQNSNAMTGGWVFQGASNVNKGRVQTGAGASTLTTGVGSYTDVMMDYGQNTAGKSTSKAINAFGAYSFGTDMDTEGAAAVDGTYNTNRFAAGLVSAGAGLGYGDDGQDSSKADSFQRFAGISMQSQSNNNLFQYSPVGLFTHPYGPIIHQGGPGAYGRKLLVV